MVHKASLGLFPRPLKEGTGLSDVVQSSQKSNPLAGRILIHPQPAGKELPHGSPENGSPKAIGHGSNVHHVK
jgi:hypothetical protein